MGELLRAERIKLLRHRATWFLVWIFPIGISAVLAGVTAYQMIRGQAPEQGPATTPGGWISNTTFPWQVASNPIGRYLLAAFMAVAFGGEYGWNTWKLVAPHRSRVALMAAKYATVLALIALSLVLAAVLATGGLWANGVLTDDPPPAGVQFPALLVAQGRAGLSAALVVVLTAAYASAGAVLTRSTIAGLVIAIVAITAESLVVSLGPRFMHPSLYQALPSHHLANLENWITEGKAVVRKFPKGAEVSLHWGWSLVSYGVWAGGLIALTFAAFRKQDLN
jgi:ABC-type transport system involved in multi-copper enzyme maturation permease subunit